MKHFSRELFILFFTGTLVWALLFYLVYPYFNLSEHAPFPARTVILFLLIWLFLRRGKESWKDFGLRRPSSVWTTIFFVIGYLGFDIFLLQPAADFIQKYLNIAPSDPSFFSYIQGNTSAYIFWLIIAWGIGGFCEELIFRGYLMNRFAQLFKSSTLGWTIALFLQALLFGLGHIYLGYGTIISVGIPALGMGVLYLLAGRNLWPVILVHGIWDTLGLTLIYLNGVPST